MNRFKRLLHIECQKYKDKGIINVIIAIFLFILILKVTHFVGQRYWPQHVQNKPLFIVTVSFLIHIVCQVVFFLLYIPGYLKKSSFYELYRINKGLTQAFDKGEDWPEKRKKLFIYLGINYLFVYPTMIYISSLVGLLKVRFEEFPSQYEMFWQLLFIIVVQDTFFYWNHKMAHQTKFLYKFHKIHHEYNQVFTLITEYFHPIDYFIGILIPSSIPFILLGGKVHCFMFFFWQAWKLFISTEEHSGYEFQWSPGHIFMFISQPSFHHFHHSANVGNYCGHVYLWDHFNGGTADQYFNRRYPHLKEKLKDN